MQEVLGWITGPVKLNTVSPTARHRRNVSWELCCPGAESRWVSATLKVMELRATVIVSLFSFTLITKIIIRQ